MLNRAQCTVTIYLHFTILVAAASTRFVDRSLGLAHRRGDLAPGDVLWSFDMCRLAGKDWATVARKGTDCRHW